VNRLLDDPVLRRLAEANPVATAELTAAESVRAEALLRTITAVPPAADVSRSRLRRFGIRITAVVAALAAALTAGVLATAPASAEHVLLEAARNAAEQPVADGQYWYVRSQSDGPDTIPYEREVWLSPDTFIMRDGFGAAMDAERKGADHVDPELVRVQDMSNSGEGGTTVPTFGDGAPFTWQELMGLPTDSAQLARAIEDRLPPTTHGRDYDMWVQVASMLRESPARPELRRALWEVLATIPGTHLLGKTTDAMGREGTAIELNLDHKRLGHDVLVLDPTTGALLESRFLVEGVEPLRSTVLEQGPRDSAPAPQPPICGPGSVPERSC
jgi:hypothetical protein